MTLHSRFIILFKVAVLLIGLGLASCAPVTVALPQHGDVPATDPLAIDGLWRLEANGKLYRIERGRMWIEEEAVIMASHYVPGQVVVQSIRQTAPQSFEGWDINLSGAWTLDTSNTAPVMQTRSLIPFSSAMTPVKLDYPDWYSEQQSASSVVPPPKALWADDAAERELSDLDLPASDILGNYHALVIGNAAYEHLTPLDTAVDDANAVSQLLRNDYGFRVTTLINATRAEMLEALRQYRETLGATDNLVIYYAGHGWLDEAADEGYWLPVNAEQDSDIEWVSNSTITGYLRSIDAKHILIVADSCYSGTLTRGVSLNVRQPSYLTKMATTRARIVLSSGGLEPVADGGGGGHSAFARAFLDTLGNNRSVIDATTLYTELRRPVMIAADQSPELADIRKAGHEGGDFLFVRSRSN